MGMQKVEEELGSDQSCVVSWVRSFSRNSDYGLYKWVMITNEGGEIRYSRSSCS